MCNRGIVRAEVEPADQGQPLRRVHLYVQRVLQRPQIQRGDERRAGAGVNQADLHGIIRNDDSGLTDQPAARAREVHHRPEITADVEVRYRHPVEAIVVAVHEGCTDDVLEPGDEGSERVAVAHAVGEAAHVDVASVEILPYVLGRYVVVRAGAGEGAVRHVQQLGGVVHIARRLSKATVYADETCN